MLGMEEREQYSVSRGDSTEYGVWSIIDEEFFFLFFFSCGYSFCYFAFYFLLFSAISMAHILMHMRRWTCVVFFFFPIEFISKAISDLTSDGGTHGRDGPGDLSFEAGFRIRPLCCMLYT